MRKRLYKYVDATAWGQKGLSPFNLAICILIVVSVFLAVIETERPIRDAYPALFVLSEKLFFVLFFVEYCLRVYVAPENPKFSGAFGRLRYIKSGWAIFDLLALISFIAPFVSNSLAFYIRLTRIIRILRVSRLGRFTQAWNLLWAATARRKFELLMSATIAFILLLISSAFLYLFEADLQPKDFGSIPRALWWSVATLTTVGYGDVTPITAAGKFFASLTAISGIGIVAMPTGILAAAFSDAFQARQGVDQNKE
ncbi:ion transporter [Marinobacter sp. 1-4A]|uniref:ion transporter n=1 Tax=Marinobacter sp. 1-4A TaxID=2582919 RepID=UPI0019075DC8|nr:ion transporter [Marinobacter sp. 1-4A]MBK1852377.1 ion transporter [Marinobacter sp. 1-4A]